MGTSSDIERSRALLGELASAVRGLALVFGSWGLKDLALVTGRTSDFDIEADLELLFPSREGLSLDIATRTP